MNSPEFFILEINELYVDRIKTISMFSNMFTNRTDTIDQTVRINYNSGVTEKIILPKIY